MLGQSYFKEQFLWFPLDTDHYLNVLCAYIISNLGQMMWVLQTASDLNFKTVLLNLNEGMSDLVSDNKD